MEAKPNKLFFVLFLVLSVGCVALVAAKESASISAVIAALGFAAATALVIGGVYAILHWCRPKWLLKFSSFAQSDYNERGGWLAGILALLVALAVSKGAFLLIEYLLISHAYGQGAWASGLRVIDKRGSLSDGGSLAGWSTITLYMGTFALTAVSTIGSYLLFRYIGFRARGRR